MKKSVIVYVSGAPGSGKTTLAKVLSEQLYIPQVSSDLIHGGVAYLRKDHDRKKTLTDIFVPTMIDMAQKGISFVVDHVLQGGISESEIIDRLRPYATIVYIHTQASNPIERYIDRTSNSTLPSIIERREQLLGLETQHRRNLSRTNQPLDLDLPTIIVYTDDGYRPGVDEIVAFIKTSF